eukprot:SAG11_NODE_17593_length_513_cov_0.725301_1_plen_41_part_01
MMMMVLLMTLYAKFRTQKVLFRVVEAGRRSRRFRPGAETPG